MNPSSKRAFNVTFMCRLLVPLKIPSPGIKGNDWLLALLGFLVPVFNTIFIYIVRPQLTPIIARQVKRVIATIRDLKTTRKNTCIECSEYSTKFLLENHSADVIFTTLRAVRTSHANGKAYCKIIIISFKITWQLLV